MTRAYRITTAMITMSLINTSIPSDAELLSIRQRTTYQFATIIGKWYKLHFPYQLETLETIRYQGHAGILKESIIHVKT